MDSKADQEAKLEGAQSIPSFDRIKDEFTRKYGPEVTLAAADQLVRSGDRGGDLQPGARDGEAGEGVQRNRIHPQHILFQPSPA